MAADKRSYNNADLTPMQVNGFKKKSTKHGNVQLKVGSTKINLPVEAHLVTTESGHGFLSVQPINAVIGAKADGSFEAVLHKEKDAAVNALKAIRKGTASMIHKARVELSEEAVKAIQKLIPAGHKLVMKGKDLTLVKTRAPKTK